MTVGRICRRDVHLAEKGETLQTAAERMKEFNVGTLVVVGSKKEPIGIVTDRDIVARALASGKGPREVLVDEVMTPQPRVVSEGAAIETALTRMHLGSFRRLPVVDASGRLVGIVTLDDILSLLAEELTLVGLLLDREMPAPSEVLKRAAPLRHVEDPRSRSQAHLSSR